MSENLSKRDRQKERRREKQEEAIRTHAAHRRRRWIYIFSVLGILLVIGLVAIFIVQQTTGDSEEATTTTEGGEGVIEYGEGACPPDEVPSEPITEFKDAPQLCLDPAKEYEAVFTTSEGTIRVRLDTERTPLTANNFYVLARNGYYNGTLLFRTDPSIGIIQGGAPHTNDPADRGPGYTIPDEGGSFSYVPGQLVMARTGAPNSASAQFFFAVNENTALLDSQGNFVVFGNTVAEDMEVLTNILDLHVDDPTSGLGGRPNREVIVEKVDIREVS